MIRLPLLRPQGLAAQVGKWGFKGARGARPTPHPRALRTGYLVMYLSSSIFEVGQEDRRKDIVAPLRIEEGVDVRRVDVLRLLHRVTEVDEAGHRLAIENFEGGVNAQDHHRVRVLPGRERDVVILDLSQEAIAVICAGERWNRELGFLEGFDNALRHLAAIGPYALNGLAVFGDPLLSDLLGFAGRPLAVLLVQNLDARFVFPHRGRAGLGDFRRVDAGDAVHDEDIAGAAKLVGKPGRPTGAEIIEVGADFGHVAVAIDATGAQHHRNALRGGAVDRGGERRAAHRHQDQRVGVLAQEVFDFRRLLVGVAVGAGVQQFGDLAFAKLVDVIARFLIEQRGPRVGRPLCGERYLVGAVFLELRGVGLRPFTGDDTLEIGARAQFSLSIFLRRRRGRLFGAGEFAA